MGNYHYVVCRKTLFGLKPVMLYTALDRARKACGKKEVILYARGEGELVRWVPKPNKEEQE